MKFQLRQYQEHSSLEVRKLLSRHRCVILCAPTGAGKTVTALDLAYRSSVKQMTSVFLTDRLELISQTFNKFKEGLHQDVTIQLYDKSSNYVYKDCYIYLSMVETFHKRQQQGKFNKKVDLLILDEAHMGNYNKVIEANPNAYVIGLTATPVSSGKVPLNTVYQAMHLSESVPNLIEKKFLVPSLDFTTHDVLNMKLMAGEFSSLSQISEFKKADNKKKLLEFLKKHSNRKYICFNINVAHSLEITDYLVKNGFNAVHVDSQSKDRDSIIKKYKNGEIQILCNVGITTKGFDDPETNGVVLNLATASISKYYQMVGRGSRPSLGKENFIVFDLGNNIFRFGSYNDETDWLSIYNNEKADIRSEIKINYICVHCGLSIKNKSIPKCPSCGSEFPRRLVEVSNKFILPKDKEYILSLDKRQMNRGELELFASHMGWKRGFAWVQWQQNSIDPSYWKHFNSEQGRKIREIQ